MSGFNAKRLGNYGQSNYVVAIGRTRSTMASVSREYNYLAKKSPDALFSLFQLGPPLAPTNLSAKASLGSALIYFNEPANGGSPITNYEYNVIGSPGFVRTLQNASPIRIGGLANDGGLVSIMLRAVNSRGIGASSEVFSFNTLNVPDAPTIDSAIRGNTQATISFFPPTNDGGLLITSYTVTSNPEGISATGSSSPIIVTGLTNGTSYTFTVIATNIIGNSISSLPSTQVTPATIPNKPTILSVIPGNEGALITFSPPNDNGGEEITSYTVKSFPGNFVATDSVESQIVITGLTNGTSYTFTLIATNNVGDSQPSLPSLSVIPGRVPDAPTFVSAYAAENGQATVSFSVPYNGGFPITSYTVKSNPDDISVTGTSSPIIVQGLTNGLEYTFTVVATNIKGHSLESSPSQPVTVLFDINDDEKLFLYAPYDNTFPNKEYWNYNQYFVDGNEGTITNNNITLTGGTPTNYSFVPGIIGPTCLRYSNIQIRHTLTNFSNDVFTFSAWIKKESFTQTRVMNFQGTNMSTRTNAFYTDGGYFAGSQLTPTAPHTQVTELFNNVWLHFVIVQSSFSLTYYVNGIVIGIRQRDYPKPIGNENAIMDIGSTGNPADVFINMDDFRLYNRPLSLYEINQLYKYGDFSLNYGPLPPTALSSVSGNKMAYIYYSLTHANGPNVAVSNYEYSTDDGATFLAFNPPQTQVPLEIRYLSSDGVTPLTNETTYSIKLRGIVYNKKSTDSATVTVTPIETKLLENNRVIYLDANTYSGSGNWTNLESNGDFSATLIGSPTFNTSETGNKYFSFNASASETIIEQYAEIAQAPQINPFVNFPITIQIWARIKNVGENGGLFRKVSGENGYALNYLSNETLRLKMDDKSQCQGEHYSLSHDKWTLYTAVIQYGYGSSRTNKIYVNGKPLLIHLQANTDYFIGSATEPLQFPGGSSSLSSVLPDISNLIGNCDVAEFYYYNTELTQTQITQNFDATKSRYGYLSNVVPSIPGSPTSVSAIAGNNHVTISFTAPLNDGGAPIATYTAISSPGNIVATGLKSPITVSGLTNGINYTFAVFATNRFGNSNPAYTSVIPDVTKPNAPTSVSAVRGNGQATVSFTHSINNGGFSITSYTVTSNPGNITASGASSPIVISGLTNGTNYTFTVIATNSLGNSSVPSSPSVWSVTSVPAIAPSPPVLVSAVKGNASATVSFVPATNNTGLPVFHTVTSNPGGISVSTVSSNATILGLTNGTEYTFTVITTNDVGSSSSSVPSPVVIPSTIPTAPTNVSAVAGNTRATISFIPSFNGSAPVTSYTVTSTSGGFTATGSSSPITVTGLTNGISYRFTVTARNMNGISSLSSQSNLIIPTTTIPDSPTSVSVSNAKNNQAVVSFTPPSNNGGLSITNYTVTSSPGGITSTGSLSPITVSGLTNGTTYTFTVVATNSKGNSLPSSPSSPSTVIFDVNRISIG